MDTTPEVWETTQPVETPDYPPVNGACRGMMFAVAVMGAFTCATVLACNLALYALAGR